MKFSINQKFVLFLSCVLLSGCGISDSSVTAIDEKSPEAQIESSQDTSDKVNELIVEKACKDFAYAIPKTDIRFPEDLIDSDEIQKYNPNWDEATKIESDLDFAHIYMLLYVNIMKSKPYPDEEWTEDLRSKGLVPRSEVENDINLFLGFREAVNNQSRLVCSKFDVLLQAPGD